MKLPFNNISEAISGKLNKNVEIISAKKLPGGHEGDSFVLFSRAGEKFFVKRVKARKHHGMRPERNMYWHLISDSMMNRSFASSDGFGVLIKNRNGFTLLDSFRHDLEIYHIQGFEELSEHSFEDLMNQRKDKKEFTNEDRIEAREVAELLGSIHKTPLKNLDKESRDKLYNESLRLIFTAQDMFFLFLHSFDDKHPIFPISMHGKYTAHLIELFQSFKDKGSRLRVLHGDFWGTNIYRKGDGTWYAIDYSRIPFGEPAIDTAFFANQLLWHYHNTGNSYFKKFGEEFLSHYAKISKDKNIKKFMALPIGLLGIISISPILYPDRIGAKSQKFFKVIKKIIKKGEFVWD
ncbi:MAG: hypothetical protein COV70_02035 [Parcubacteria group bacterium CG11_big_fil_rev_8_21_14_0_20_39_22]|nr:MAG: hypothetical protein COV70_02035 [Parcubacteria group bacterium CG11_big_fil_rev_8_21_14_0_20_39_22]